MRPTNFWLLIEDANQAKISLYPLNYAILYTHVHTRPTRKKKAGASSVILWLMIMGMSGTAIPMGDTALCLYPVSSSFTSGLHSRKLYHCFPIYGRWRAGEKTFA